jgi:hypothetical protein
MEAPAFRNDARCRYARAASSGGSRRAFSRLWTARSATGLGVRPGTVVVEADRTGANASPGGETHEVAELQLSNGHLHAVDPVEGLVLERNSLHRASRERRNRHAGHPLEAGLHSIDRTLSTGAEA